VSQWRDLTPANAINQRAEHDPTYKDWSAKLIHVSGFTDFLNPVIQDWIMQADHVRVQRNAINQQVLDAIEYFQGLNKIVTIDLDDAYHILPWSNPAHAFWIENGSQLEPPPLEMLEKALRLSDGLTAPNRNLLADWSHVTQGYYLPNFADDKFWHEGLPTRAEQKAKFNLTDRIVIGWGGSVSHYDSWWGTGIYEAARDLVAKFPNITFMLCGNDPRVYDALRVPLVNKFLQPGVPPADWPAIIKTFDIGVAPLYGIYDQRRSWIKALEYNLAGVPWVGTTGEPYRDLAHTGYVIENSAANWYNALARIIRNLETEQAQAAARVPQARALLAVNQMAAYEKVYTQIAKDIRIKRGRLPMLHFVNWPETA